MGTKDWSLLLAPTRRRRHGGGPPVVVGDDGDGGGRFLDGDMLEAFPTIQIEMDDKESLFVFVFVFVVAVVCCLIVQSFRFMRAERVCLSDSNVLLSREKST